MLKTAFFVVLFAMGALICIGLSVFSLSLAVESMHNIVHDIAKDLGMRLWHPNKGWEDA